MNIRPLNLSEKTRKSTTLNKECAHSNMMIKLTRINPKLRHILIEKIAGFNLTYSFIKIKLWL